jgi:hypothetical protein
MRNIPSTGASSKGIKNIMSQADFFYVSLRLEKLAQLQEINN